MGTISRIRIVSLVVGVALILPTAYVAEQELFGLRRSDIKAFSLFPFSLSLVRFSHCSRGPTFLDAPGAPPPGVPHRASRSRRLKALARSRSASSAFAEAPADRRSLGGGWSRLARAAGAFP